MNQKCIRKYPYIYSQTKLDFITRMKMLEREMNYNFGWKYKIAEHIRKVDGTNHIFLVVFLEGIGKLGSWDNLPTNF